MSPECGKFWQDAFVTVIYVYPVITLIGGILHFAGIKSAGVHDSLAFLFVMLGFSFLCPEYGLFSGSSAVHAGADCMSNTDRMLYGCAALASATIHYVMKKMGKRGEARTDVSAALLPAA
eukprot:TRINITY_DN17320_c0_g1_i2.p1 TRINITY_DN17320_c0_g1~~TRINITY_DN17320_c0_g1_i2.p1  ORF type:complete len:139 (+),score=18.57 TRINITY_DN17320_c0_g1_i2:60-419(+)